MFYNCAVVQSVKDGRDGNSSTELTLRVEIIGTVKVSYSEGFCKCLLFILMRFYLRGFFFFKTFTIKSLHMQG